MNLLAMSILARRTAPAPRTVRTRPDTPVVAPVPAAPDGAPADEPDTPPPCGWFDSSHELRRGLVVTELEQPESVARVVPLSWWLQWQLSR
jgi:hypothetical protein